MTTKAVLTNARDCVIELSHRDSDPGMWIVRHSTKFLWFKKTISSDWFNSEAQALAFAREIEQEHCLRQGA